MDIWTRRETVTLVLQNKRFKVSRQQLTSKSLYFSLLFSTDYCDHRRREQIIKYEISLATMQDFINWIEDDELYVPVYCRVIKPCLEKFFKAGIMELLELLQLSILFMVDELTNECADIIETYWMIPSYAIDIWLLAQDLFLPEIRNVALSVCLDRFDELPVKSIYSLPKDDFILLIGNTNIRSTENKLHRIIFRWMKVNNDIISSDITVNKVEMLSNGITTIMSKEQSTQNLALYCWNRDNFHPINIKDYPTDITYGPPIVGMQTVGRGCNVYIVGGEFGIGSGKFNVKVWRYSLISEKWFYVTTMPSARRHMVAAVLKNKLVLVGGVGRCRIKLSSVDIFNMYTGVWTKGAHIPEKFTEVPHHCAYNEKLAVFIPLAIYIYFLIGDVWKKIEPCSYIPCTLNTPLLSFTNALYYIVNLSDRLVLRNIVVYRRTPCRERYCVELKLRTMLNLDPNRPYRNEGLFYIVLSNDQYILIFGDRNMYRNGTIVHIHTTHMGSQDFPSFASESILPTPLFQIMQPSDLHVQSVPRRRLLRNR